MVVVQIGDSECSSEAEENVDPYREFRRFVRIPSTPRWFPVQDPEATLEVALLSRLLIVCVNTILG